MERGILPAHRAHGGQLDHVLRDRHERRERLEGLPVEGDAQARHDDVDSVGDHLTDRFDARWLLFWFYGLRGLSLFALPFALDHPELGLAPFVIVFGLDFVATVPPTVALTAQAFGTERVGVLFAWIFASHQIGGAAAAGLAGGARDWFGDYTAAWVGGGILCLVASALVLRIRPARTPAPTPA